MALSKFLVWNLACNDHFLLPLPSGRERKKGSRKLKSQNSEQNAQNQKHSSEIISIMFGRSRFLSFPMVIGAVVIGVVSGKAIFGPPLDEYWKKKHQEEASQKENDSNST